MLGIKWSYTIFWVLMLLANLTSNELKRGQDNDVLHHTVEEAGESTYHRYLTMISVEDDQLFIDFTEKVKHVISKYNVIIDYAIRPTMIWAEGPEAPDRNGKDSIDLPDYLFVWHFENQKTEKAFFNSQDYLDLKNQHQQIMTIISVRGQGSHPTLLNATPENISTFFFEILYMDKKTDKKSLKAGPAEQVRNRLQNTKVSTLMTPGSSNGVELPDIINVGYFKTRKEESDFLKITGADFREHYGESVESAGWVIGKSIELFRN